MATERFERFTIGEALSFGWDTMKNNLMFFILALLIAWVANGIPSGLQGLCYSCNSGGLAILGTILAIISFVVGVFMYMAFTRIGLRFTAGETADYADLYLSYPLFWKFLGGYILYGLIVLGGLILLIVPGIYWGIKYHFFAYFIIDEGVGPTEALKRSGEITYGAKWELLLLALAFLGINLLGLLACFVGLFVSVPITIVATAYVYRRLLATKVARPAQAPAPEGPPEQPQAPAPEGPPEQPPA